MRGAWGALELQHTDTLSHYSSILWCVTLPNDGGMGRPGTTTYRHTVTPALYCGVSPCPMTGAWGTPELQHTVTLQLYTVVCHPARGHGAPRNYNIHTHCHSSSILWCVTLPNDGGMGRPGTTMYIPDLPTFYAIKAEDLLPFGQKHGRFLCSENIEIFYLPVTQNEPIFPVLTSTNSTEITKLLQNNTTFIWLSMLFAMTSKLWKKQKNFKINRKAEDLKSGVMTFSS